MKALPLFFLLCTFYSFLIFVVAQDAYAWPLWIKIPGTVALLSLVFFAVAWVWKIL